MIIDDYLIEAINLELNVSNLYMLFSSQHTEDYVFWFSLAIEEGGHAAILKNIQSAFGLVEHKFKLTNDDLLELKLANTYIKSLIGDKKYTRAETFNIAIGIESAAGEIHYQKLMNSETHDAIIDVFIKLNKDDEHHLERIKDYADTNGIIYE